MIIKRFFAAAALAVLIGTTASAAPTASLSGTSAGGGLFNWTLSFTPDSALFSNNAPNGVGGSLATAFQIEVAPGGLVQNSWNILTGFNEPTSALNPGFDPYTNDPSGITEGVTDYANVAGDLDAGMRDAIFVPLGSTYFTSGGAKDALTFQTSVNTVRFGGLIAQNNNNGIGTDDVYTIAAATATAGPGFSFADFNTDTFVDDLDLAAFFGQWGSASGSFADFNTDNIVDDLDLAAFFGQWNPAGALSTSTAVPEPSTLAVVGLALVGLGLVVRRK